MGQYAILALPWFALNHTARSFMRNAILVCHRKKTSVIPCIFSTQNPPETFCRSGFACISSNPGSTRSDGQ